MDTLILQQDLTLVKTQAPPAWEIGPDPDSGDYVAYMDGAEVAYGPTRLECWQSLMDVLRIRHKHAMSNPAEWPVAVEAVAV